VNYLPYALLALLTYTLVPPLVSIATRSGGLSADAVALVSNAVLVGVAAVLIVATNQGDAVREAVVGPRAPYVFAAGVCLAVGILAYYRALRLGPVSVVTPVFGMFLVTTSVVGVLVLDESFTLRKAAGVGCALAAIYLTTTE
jgi:transporter family protein